MGVGVLRPKFMNRPSLYQQALMYGVRSQAGKAVRERIAEAKKWAPRRNPYGPSIYVMQAKEWPYLKIGFAWDPLERKAALQSAIPMTLEIVACVAAPLSLEKAIHRHLSGHSFRSEWYHRTPEVLAFANALTKPGAQAAIDDFLADVPKDELTGVYLRVTKDLTPLMNKLNEL